MSKKPKKAFSKNFDYEYFGDYNEKQILKFSDIQEADLNKILEFLKVKKTRARLRYKIYPTLKEKQKSDPYHSISHACARTSENAIYRVLGPEMDVLSFPHELVHLVAHEISPHYEWEVTLDTADGKKQTETLEMSSTSFLQEGLAILIDELVFDNKLREAGEYRYIDEWVSFNKEKHDIEPHDIFEFYKFCEQPPLFATPICASFCKFLFVKYGLDKFMELYKSSSEMNTNVENIRLLENIYQKSIQKIEADWRRNG